MRPEGTRLTEGGHCVCMQPDSHYPSSVPHALRCSGATFADGQGWICTRERGHGGAHVACARAHNLHCRRVWIPRNDEVEASLSWAEDGLRSFTISTGTISTAL